MSATNSSPRITLRIPADWSHPRELVERLPDGFRLTHEELILPDATRVEFTPMPPDEQFPQIFQTSCRRPPREGELAVVGRYTVNIGLSGPGGSLDAALTMMQAGAAIVRAGGAGVFIDNSALSHGGADWIEMTDDAGSDAISYAFASVVRGRREAFTMGMSVMGFPDLTMSVPDFDGEEESFIDMIRYICSGGAPVDVGHMFANELGIRYQVVAKLDDDFNPDGPMHNPYGRLKIKSVDRLAESN